MTNPHGATSAEVHELIHGDTGRKCTPSLEVKENSHEMLLNARNDKNIKVKQFL